MQWFPLPILLVMDAQLHVDGQLHLHLLLVAEDQQVDRDRHQLLVHLPGHGPPAELARPQTRESVPQVELVRLLSTVTVLPAELARVPPTGVGPPVPSVVQAVVHIHLKHLKADDVQDRRAALGFKRLYNHELSNKQMAIGPHHRLHGQEGW